MDKLFKRLKEVKLEKEKRESFRSFLVSFIKDNPVRNRGFVRQDYQRSNIYNQLTLLFKKPMPVPIIAALIIVLGGGGASFAAEGAVPGDVLYPLKLQVNEKVLSSVNFSPEAKAQWEIKLADRRLEEAEKLSSEGKLTADKMVTIESNFKDQAEKIQERIKEFENKDNGRAGTEISANFETSLRVHEKILNRLAEININNEEATQTEKLAQEVKNKKDIMVGIRERIEARLASSTASSTVDVKAAAEGKLTAAENKIAEVKKYIESIKSRWTITSTTTATTTEAEAQLKIAEDTIVEGKAKLSAGDYGQAFILFQKAQWLAQEAKQLIKAERNLKIEIRHWENHNATTATSTVENGKGERGEHGENNNIKTGIHLQFGSTSIDIGEKGKIKVGF